MRITEEEKVKIKSIINKAHPHAKIYLFGSRTDDSKRGGDIDILILDEEKISFEEKLDIIVDLNIEIGEQKYDVVTFGNQEHSAFKSHILNTAILL